MSMAEIPMRPTLYVCAPFATRTPVEAAETAALVLRAVRLGWAPVFAPDLYRHVLDEATGRDAGLSCAMSLLRRCDALVIVGSRVTQGMEAELRWWLYRGFPTYTAVTLAEPRGSAWFEDPAGARFDRLTLGGGVDVALNAIRAEIGAQA